MNREYEYNVDNSTVDAAVGVVMLLEVLLLVLVSMLIFLSYEILMDKVLVRARNVLKLFF